ncbi:hypothetical protein BD770DRAFT_401628 [Pilaira anomala]|nr:hypothetical protein BD770DRAFT_401628 [Pilaira anomala]
MLYQFFNIGNKNINKTVLTFFFFRSSYICEIINLKLFSPTLRQGLFCPLKLVIFRLV